LCGAEGELGVGAGDALGVGSGDVVSVGTGDTLGVVAGDMLGVAAGRALAVGPRDAAGVVAGDCLGVECRDGGGVVGTIGPNGALGFDADDALGAGGGSALGVGVGAAVGVGAVEVLGTRVGVGTGGVPRPMTAAAPTAARIMARRHLVDHRTGFNTATSDQGTGRLAESAHRRGQGCRSAGKGGVSRMVPTTSARLAGRRGRRIDPDGAPTMPQHAPLPVSRYTLCRVVQRLDRIHREELPW